mgnify:CR=1 FL=1
MSTAGVNKTNSTTQQSTTQQSTAPQSTTTPKNTSTSNYNGKPVLYNQMDDKNKVAADILATKGPDAAVSHMMSSAGGDYGTMRMMYG